MFSPPCMTHVLAALTDRCLTVEMRSDAWRRGFRMNRCNHAGVGRKRGQKGTSAVRTLARAPGKTAAAVSASARDGRQTDSRADPGKCYFASRSFADAWRGGRAGGKLDRGECEERLGSLAEEAVL